MHKKINITEKKFNELKKIAIERVQSFTPEEKLYEGISKEDLDAYKEILFYYTELYNTYVAIRAEILNMEVEMNRVAKRMKELKEADAGMLTLLRGDFTINEVNELAEMLGAMDMLAEFVDTAKKAKTVKDNGGNAFMTNIFQAISSEKN